jgi:indole-3-glycerol phosphate synthase
MPTTLDQIVAATRIRLAERKRIADLPTLERQAQEHVPRGFRSALARRAVTGTAIIAELKKASPSKGLIREAFDVKALAREYAEAGATALSVLTEEQFFLGSLENLRIASACTTLPCLRKDFIVEEFQLLEALAYGADAVLLLASVLDDRELASLYRRAGEWKLDVLCEVHDELELQRALQAGCDVIGVNSRDLRSFQVNLETAISLGPRIPAGVVKVAESGIHSSADVKILRAAGYQAFLVGESLMRAERPGQALAKLLEAS